MKLKPRKLAPGLICLGVIGLGLALQLLPEWTSRFDMFQRIEWMTYDWRMTLANAYTPREPTALGAVFIDEESWKYINDRMGIAWPWPRRFYGRLVRMLAGQGVKAIGFDILFDQRQPPDPKNRVTLGDGTEVSSDDYFARQLRRAGNVALAAMGETSGTNWQAILPAELFRTNAWAVAHITSDKDADGVLRRAKAFQDDPRYGRIWHLGLVLAARELGLDLKHAIVEPSRIRMRGTNGMERILPVDPAGYFYINWSLAWNDPRLARGSFAEVAGLKVGGPPPTWRDKLVVVGSILAGNNLSDIGATSLSKETYLVSKHWNVAQSVITGRFVHPPPRGLASALIVLLGLFSAWLTWKLRPPWSTAAVVTAMGLYVALAVGLFVYHLFWLPLVIPLVIALLMNHGGLVTYQVVQERREKRRVKQVFAKLVAPDVVNELLGAEQINLGGTRREVTVMFADIRGFTSFTDDIQANAELYVYQNKLTGEAAEAYYNEQAELTLDTVNPYMSLIADQVKSHHGTLDKYIGDCVMAYWGAPTPNEKHAVWAVRAAIASQRAIHELNVQRRRANQQREQENAARMAAGQSPLLPYPLLALGTGINTGVVIVGLMGSDEHGVNYTVFGRDVNLASRLESVSGRSRIVIGKTTYLALQQHDPELAGICLELEPTSLKGIRLPVRMYEVPWQDKDHSTETFDTEATYPKAAAPPPSPPLNQSGSGS